MAKLHDLVIRNVEIYDGTGAPPRTGALAIDGDRIAEVGAVAEAGALELDASGLAAAPGFIDVHTHDDFAVVLDPEVRFKTLQGVTSEVVGNCGMGAAPFRMASLVAGAFHPGRALPEWEGYRGGMYVSDASAWQHLLVLAGAIAILLTAAVLILRRRELVTDDHEP